MMKYTFYLHSTYYFMFATTYEGACRAFRDMTSAEQLNNAIVTSVQKAA